MYLLWKGKKVKVLVAQTLDPMGCSPPGSSVHEILQAGILEWVACPSPGDLHNLGTEPWSPALQVDSLPSEPRGNPFLLWRCGWRMLPAISVNTGWCRPESLQPALPRTLRAFRTQKTRILTLNSYSAHPRNNHKLRLLHLPIQRKALKLTWDVWLFLWLAVIFWCLTTWFRFWLLFFPPTKIPIYPGFSLSLWNNS